MNEAKKPYSHYLIAFVVIIVAVLAFALVEGSYAVAGKAGKTGSSRFNFNISVSPSSGTVMQGSVIGSTVTVTLISGTPKTVTLSQTGCPPAATCTFNPGSGLPTYTSALRVATTSSTSAGTYPITLIGTSVSKTRTTLYTLTVTTNQTNQTCTRANPTVSISPSIKSGTPGQTLNYTTTVTNRDNSACGNSTFDMTYTIPATWSAFFNPTSLIIAPGMSKSTTFFITSSTNSTPANYTFTNLATNRDFPSFQGSASATYKVV